MTATCEGQRKTSLFVFVKDSVEAAILAKYRPLRTGRAKLVAGLAAKQSTCAVPAAQT